jgi:nucleoside-diphosphate-sugar epimerase
MTSPGSQPEKVAIITGASQGIGAGLVEAYRHAGYAVVGTSRSISPSDEPDAGLFIGKPFDEYTPDDFAAVTAVNERMPSR